MMEGRVIAVFTSILKYIAGIKAWTIQWGALRVESKVVAWALQGCEQGACM